MNDFYEIEIIDLDGNITKEILTLSQEQIELRNEYIYKQKTKEFERLRSTECFPVVDRGKLWYDTLTEQQLSELSIWRQEWLDVTTTRIVPTKPLWIE